MLVCEKFLPPRHFASDKKTAVSPCDVLNVHDHLHFHVRRISIDLDVSQNNFQFYIREHFLPFSCHFIPLTFVSLYGVLWASTNANQLCCACISKHAVHGNLQAIGIHQLLHASMTKKKISASKTFVNTA